MPILRPITALTIYLPVLQLDLDVDAGRQVEPHERVHSLWRGLEHVDQTLVRSDLELFPRIFIDEGAAEHGVAVDLRGKGHRAGDACPGPLRCIDDLRGRLVQNLVIVGLEPDPNALFS